MRLKIQTYTADTTTLDIATGGLRDSRTPAVCGPAVYLHALYDKPPGVGMARSALRARPQPRTDPRLTPSTKRRWIF